MSAKRRSSRRKATLRQPTGSPRSEDLLHFIEADGFWEDWTDLGLDDSDLCELQIAIMTGGKRAPVIAGTGGLRKLRFAPASWNVGKSGSLRVCFAIFEEAHVVFLVVVYAKNERDNISAASKKALRMLIEEMESYFRR